MRAWPIFDYRVIDGDDRFEGVFTARDRSAARYELFQLYRSANWRISFREWLAVVRLTTRSASVDDGYSYVRRVYGVDPKIGQRVRLKDGREGQVVYPNGPSTSMVRCALDGAKHATVVHPSDVVLL